jgi:hypothetical protein
MSFAKDSKISALKKKSDAVARTAPQKRRRSCYAERPNCERSVDTESRAAKLSFRSGGPMPSEAFGSKARQRDGQNHDHGDHRAGDQPTHENLPFIATKWRFSSLQQSRGPESRPAKGFLSSPEDDEKSDGARKF